MKILNLGAGHKLIDGAVNADAVAYPGINYVVDLSVHPWPWDDNEFDMVVASHVMEHFFDQRKFINECYRVLRPGGWLKIVGPHSSCVSSIGQLGHYRTYCYNTFDEYLAKPNYYFDKAMFKTKEMYINWWYEKTGDNVPKWMLLFLVPLNFVISFLIRLSPQVFENLWWPLIGGAREVVWFGEKI